MTASFADQDIWHVLVASDDMKRMNVEQLDDAFRLSLVDASTLVWKAGMATWQRLGSVAGIEDEEPQTVTKQMNAETLAELMRVPPPPPPPKPAPAPLRARSLPPSPPRPIRQPYAAPVVATPMYMPQLVAPDPFALPQRRAKLPSEVNFRGSSGGFRVGRWLVGLLLVTTGVLVCYRQNLLRDGARKIGLENKYLYGEKRVTAYVSARAPRAVQDVLERLALLPGPNASPAVTSALAPRATAATTPTPELPVKTEAAPGGDKLTPSGAAPAAPSPREGESTSVKTVSLDSLPVLAGEAADSSSGEKHASASPRASESKAASAPLKTASAPLKTASVAAKTRSVEPAPAPKAAKSTKVAKAETKAEVEPKPKPKAEPKPSLPPPSANEGFLKAAIRSAIAADGKK